MSHHANASPADDVKRTPNLQQFEEETAVGVKQEQDERTCGGGSGKVSTQK